MSASSPHCFSERFIETTVATRDRSLSTRFRAPHPAPPPRRRFGFVVLTSARAPVDGLARERALHVLAAQAAVGRAGRAAEPLAHAHLARVERGEQLDRGRAPLALGLRVRARAARRAQRGLELVE